MVWTVDEPDDVRGEGLDRRCDFFETRIGVFQYGK
jgi:hypothetical protein